MERPPEAVSVPDAFERLYAAEYLKVVALMTALSGSRWVAEDLAQEAFLRAHRDWTRVGALDAPEAWVRRVAINLAHSRFRRLRTEAAVRLRLRAADPAPAMAPGEDAFWNELRSLPRRQAEALALRYVEDLPTAGIATVMGIAEGTVRALLTQGRERLSRQLSAKGWIDE